MGMLGDGLTKIVIFIARATGEVEVFLVEQMTTIKCCILGQVY